MTPLAELAVLQIAPRSPGTGTTDPAQRERLIGRAKALSWISLAWMAVEGASRSPPP